MEKKGEGSPDTSERRTETTETKETDAKRVYNSTSARPIRRQRMSHYTAKPYTRTNGMQRRNQQRKRDAQEILGTGLQRKVLNWMKRFLAQKYIKHNTAVLDLCCGRGQDLFKYHHQRVNRLIMIDAAEQELQFAQATYAQEEALFRSTFGRERAPTFLCSDLRVNTLTIQPKVETVCCQLALHYLWAEQEHVDNFFHTVTSSLLPKGFFLLTILDAEQIPVNGLKDHPYMWFSPTYPYAKEEKGEKKSEMLEGKEVEHEEKRAYTFTYKGRITEPVEEIIITKASLLRECSRHSLKWIQDYNVDDVKQAIFAFHTNPDVPLQISADDWLALRMFRCYAFQYVPTS